MAGGFDDTIAAARACELCKVHLPLGPRPVFQISPTARILVVGQAPGRKVHDTGIPFNDPSGVRLRNWMGVDAPVFYDSSRIALLPMGLCYPGTGKSGDLPPRPECAVQWRRTLLDLMPDIQLMLVIGQYAHAWHLGPAQKNTLTETVQNWQNYWPRVAVLPHPSPRNNIWLKKNPWFEKDVVPAVREKIAGLLKQG